MSWTSIIDQHRTVDALRSTISSERIGHAYLFHGPDGVGKRAVALEFAKTLLCEREGDEACDKCLTCTKVGRMVHPDLHILFAYPTDTEPEDVAERIQLLGKNPYAAVDFVRRPSLGDTTKSSNKQALYTVGRMHDEVRRTMNFKPVEGRYKIVILTDADLLRTEAANAFLKLLEEPPPRSVFVLITSRPERLLPTIVSRCQRFRFDPLPPEAIERALMEKESMEPAPAKMLARMANGSYTEALEFKDNEELMGLRALVLDFLRFSYGRSIDRLADLIEKISRLGRDQIKGLLDLMLRWIRDLTLYRTLGDEASIINVDQRDAIAKFSANLPNADLEAMAKLVEGAIDLIERNVQINLTLIVFAQSLGHAMRGPHDGMLYVPLTEPRGGWGRR
ncbi:MAG: DNA polymerase III subunit delta' [Rhodothermales bacterium]